jgi:hypothetical protein
MAHTSTDAGRAELHELLDHIPASDIPTARKFLQALADPVWRAIMAAPEDDEGECRHEQAAAEAARSEQTPGTPHEDVLREFGL